LRRKYPHQLVYSGIYKVVNVRREGRPEAVPVLAVKKKKAVASIASIKPKKLKPVIKKVASKVSVFAFLDKDVLTPRRCSPSVKIEKISVGKLSLHRKAKRAEKMDEISSLIDLLSRKIDEEKANL
jgi:hypothetical protein